MTKRLKTSLIGGIILGIICVIGAYVRSGFTSDPNFLFSLWYNRLIMGLVIGATWPETNRKTALLRGALLGLLVSFSFYSSTGYADSISFGAGIVYGVILELYLTRSN